jgi:hypothetical protein
MKDFEEWKKLHNFYKYSAYLTKDMADFLKVSPRTIQRWIKGSTKPDQEKLESIKLYLASRDFKKLPNSPPNQ